VRYAGNGDAAMLRVDLLQIIVIAVTFPWLVFIGNRVKRLRDADRRKDDFLATLAHELRNPLAPIRTGIDILRTKEGVAKADAVLPMMDRQVGHLTRLLDDLLDVSRIAHGKMTLHPAATDLREAVEAGVDASRPLIEHMGHALKVTLPAQPIVLRADPVRLAQIVSNLLNNAARYTPPHGAISLSAQRDGDLVEIVVRDNGIGIPAERRESIFEMFAQVDSSQPASAGGLGIGLALVKGLVALHGGTVEARSDGPGRGSEFRVRLPARVESAPAPAVVPAQSGRATREAILVVDDHRDAAASLATLLELKGHEVIVAYDGAMSIAVAEEFRPQLVLLDLGMPGMDGYEVCREIRKRDWGRGIRIVAVTGWGQDEDRHNTSMAGFDEHLVKPITAEAVEQLCARLHDAAATNETKARRR
jgi:CheY-like chemotaxis protein/two-component sensor histidine kinase